MAAQEDLEVKEDPVLPVTERLAALEEEVDQLRAHRNFDAQRQHLSNMMHTALLSSSRSVAVVMSVLVQEFAANGIAPFPDAGDALFRFLEWPRFALTPGQRVRISAAATQMLMTVMQDYSSMYKPYVLVFKAIVHKNREGSGLDDLHIIFHEAAPELMAQCEDTAAAVAMLTSLLRLVRQSSNPLAPKYLLTRSLLLHLSVATRSSDHVEDIRALLQAAQLAVPDLQDRKQVFGMMAKEAMRFWGWPWGREERGQMALWDLVEQGLRLRAALVATDAAFCAVRDVIHGLSVGALQPVLGSTLFLSLACTGTVSVKRTPHTVPVAEFLAAAYDALAIARCNPPSFETLSDALRRAKAQTSVFGSLWRSYPTGDDAVRCALQFLWLQCLQQESGRQRRQRLIMFFCGVPVRHRGILVHPRTVESLLCTFNGNRAALRQDVSTAADVAWTRRWLLPLTRISSRPWREQLSACISRLPTPANDCHVDDSTAVDRYEAVRAAHGHRAGHEPQDIIAADPVDAFECMQLLQKLVCDRNIDLLMVNALQHMMLRFHDTLIMDAGVEGPLFPITRATFMDAVLVPKLTPLVSRDGEHLDADAFWARVKAARPDAADERLQTALRCIGLHLWCEIAAREMRACDAGHAMVFRVFMRFAVLWNAAAIEAPIQHDDVCDVLRRINYATVSSPAAIETTRTTVLADSLDDSQFVAQAKRTLRVALQEIAAHCWET